MKALKYFVCAATLVAAITACDNGHDVEVVFEEASTEIASPEDAVEEPKREPWHIEYESENISRGINAFNPTPKPAATTEQVYAEVPTGENGYVGEFELTAYEETGSACADGVYPQVGYTVACNDSRLWHKWVYIEGYGTYYVHDTGGMATNVIDIYLGDYNECIQFGRQHASVYIVEE